MITHRWLDYEPPSLCHFDFGIGETLAAVGLGAGAALPEVAAEGAIGAAAGGVGAAGFGGSTVAAASGLGLGTVGAIASAGGTLLSAKAQADQADYAQKLAVIQAQNLRDKANQDAAAGEQAQIQQNRKTDLVLSRARALAAGSGTEATSGDVLNTESQIAGQGNYNALTALYEGQAAARSDNQQADIALFRGRQAQAALPYEIGGTLLSGISSYARDRVRTRQYQLGGYNPF
jgi:hypothetical protein